MTFTTVQKVLVGLGVTTTILGVAYIIYFFATRSSSKAASVRVSAEPPESIVAAVQQPQNSRKAFAS